MQPQKHVLVLPWCSMQRSVLLGLFLLLYSCARAPKSFEEILPPELSGGWKRTAITRSAAIPPAVSQLGNADAAEATYSGVGTVRLSVYRMKSETAAFELMQKWRTTDGF